MPIITRFSPRFEKLMALAQEKLGRPVLVKTNPIMPLRDQFGMVFPLERPMEQNSYKAIPVYIAPTPDHVSDQGEMTISGEFHAAHQIARFVTYKDGYKPKRVSILIENTATKRLGPEIMARIDAAIRISISHMNSFSSTPAVNNLMAQFGYDPSADHYSEGLIDGLPEIRENFSNLWISMEMAGMNLSPDIDPFVTRILMLDGTIALAGMYLYLPGPMRDELMKNLGSLWRDRVLDLIKQAGLEYDYEYLIGPEFGKYFTKEVYKATRSKVYGYCAGREGFATFRNDPIDLHNEYCIKHGKEAFDSGDYLLAYHFYCVIVGRDASKEVERTKRAIIRTLFSKYPNSKLRDVEILAVKAMMERNLYDAANAFQEDAFGVEADLDKIYSGEGA